ncbi:hypothetical protein EMPS_04974 [Entomortierella parvispora]|uniref:Cas12f1-like TNB domain-containing protein n=1 Tax=Entomortierella parvispora TaxID=205924 RepID=A0A9P3H9L4_9FUNG|nr:hypothetical protein EMPS_04974 [Entomortierella parvispora]
MGVASTWPYLANIEGLEYPEVVPKDVFPRVHIDIPAILFALVRSIRCNKIFAEMKNHMNSSANLEAPYMLPAEISLFLTKVPPLETDAIKSNTEFLSLIGSESTLPPVPSAIFEIDISAAIDKTLLKKFSKDQGILHFDGARTIQKTYARQKRDRSRIGAIAAFVHKASSVLSHLAHLHSQVSLKTAAGKAKPTKNQVLRLVKRIRGPLIKAWINTKAISHKDWDTLGNQLGSKGWKVHACPGEADVCISRHAEEEQEDTVVASADSDNVFHGASYVLRKSPQGGRYYKYDIGAILGSLELSYEQWQAVAVLAENDYDRKVPGLGLTKIVDTIRDMDEMPDMPKAVDYVKKFCSQKSIDQAVFENSVDIFVDNKQDIDTGIILEDNAAKLVDHLMLHIVNEVSKLRYRNKRTKPTARSSASSLPVVPEGGSSSQTETKQGFLRFMWDRKRPDYLSKIRHHDRTAWSESLPPGWSRNEGPVGLYDQSIGPPKVHPVAPNATHTSNSDNQTGSAPLATDLVNQNLEGDNPAGSSSIPTASTSQKRPLSQEASQKKKKKTNEKKAATSKPVYNRSSRKARHAVNKQMGDLTSSAGSVTATRREHDTTHIKATLETTFSQVALQPGTLCSTLYKGLESQMKGSTLLEVQDTYRSMRTMMMDLVKANSDAVWSAIAVLQDYALSIFKSHPTLDEDDVKKRKDALGPVYTSQIFVYHVVRALWRWSDLTDATLTQLKCEGTQRLAFTVVLEFKKKHSNQQAGGIPFDPFTKRPEKAVSAKFLESCARSTHDLICSLVLRNVGELKQRVLVQQIQFSKSEQGRLFLDSIEGTGRSKLHDPVSVHLLLNALLRPDSQVALFPVIAFKDRDLDLTEREFVDACRHLKPTPTTKSALGAVFTGTVVAAEQRAIAHRGELFFNLFMSKNTSYRRGTALMNPAMNSERALFIPDSRLRIQTELEHLDEYTSIDKTLCALLKECSSLAKKQDPGLADSQDLLHRISVFQGQWSQLPGNPPPTIANIHTTSGSISNALKSMEVELQRLKDVLSNMSATQQRQLRDVTLHGLHAGSSSSAENTPRRHYVPTGVIKTDGHNLHVLAFDLTTLRPKKNTKSKPSPTGSGYQHNIPAVAPEEGFLALPSALPFAASSALPSSLDIYDSELWTSPDPVLEESLPGSETENPNEGPSVGHGNPGQGQVAQPNLAGVKTAAVHAKALPYVQDLFSTAQRVQSLGGPHFIGIGVDPGRAKPASVVAVHTKYPDFSQTLDITDTVAKDIQKRYMGCLNAKKKTHGIDKLENTLIADVAPVQVKVTQENGTTVCDWRAAASALYSNHLDWLRPRLAAFEKLRTFYGSISFKKDLYDMKTAIRSDRSLVCAAAIKMAHIPHPNIPPTDVLEYRETPAVLGIGDGDFDGRKEKTLDELARTGNANGIPAVKLPEFRSSQFCSRCRFRAVQKGRSILCENCSWDIDRDHNAGENLARCLGTHLQTQTWPAPLDKALAKVHSRE